MNIFSRVNNLAKKVFVELGRQVIGVRVFYNSLLLYFDDGCTRFYSKMGQDWGDPNAMYFVTSIFSLSTISERLYDQYEELIDWTYQWVNSNLLERVGLLIMYITNFSGRTALL